MSTIEASKNVEVATTLSPSDNAYSNLFVISSRILSSRNATLLAISSLSHICSVVTRREVAEFTGQNLRCVHTYVWGFIRSGLLVERSVQKQLGEGFGAIPGKVALTVKGRAKCAEILEKIEADVDRMSEFLDDFSNKKIF